MKRKDVMIVLFLSDALLPQRKLKARKQSLGEPKNLKKCKPEIEWQPLSMWPPLLPYLIFEDGGPNNGTENKINPRILRRSK